MITCKFNVEKQEVTISGHAMFAPKGQDLVCAAVTGITFGAANYIAFKDSGICSQGVNHLYIKFKDARDMDMMMYQLKTIELSYPKNLKLVEE